MIEAKHVAIANTRLYVNWAEGFIGTSLKKDDFLVECSDIDDIIAFTRRGHMKVVKVSDKVFIGKDIIYAAVFRKGDERTTYNMLYTDGESGTTFAKRFNVTGITRDKEYDLTKGHERSKVHYFSTNPNGEAEVVRILLSPNCAAKKKELDFYFEEIEIKSRSSIGNQVTKYPVRSVKFKEAGVATLGSIRLWFDDKFGRLNHDGKGIELGNFEAEDRVLLIYTDGTYEITDQELTQRFNPEEVMLVEKYNPDHIITAVYLDSDKGQYNVKRFRIETTRLRERYPFIKEGKDNLLEAVSTESAPVLVVEQGKGTAARRSKYKIADMVDVMGWKAVGAKLVDFNKNVMMEWEVSGDGKQKELF